MVHVAIRTQIDEIHGATNNPSISHEDPVHISESHAHP
jgi:hypothetical protein